MIYHTGVQHSDGATYAAIKTAAWNGLGRSAPRCAGQGAGEGSLIFSLPPRLRALLGVLLLVPRLRLLLLLLLLLHHPLREGAHGRRLSNTITTTTTTTTITSVIISININHNISLSPVLLLPVVLGAPSRPAKRE